MGELLLAASPPMITGDDEIPALGKCVRPTADEKTALLEVVKAKTKPEVTVRFGCKDADGIVLEVAFEAKSDAAKGGIWRVVRANPPAAAAKLTTVAELAGPAPSTWQEWMDETTLSVLALGDLDGDLKREIILDESHHEGGAWSSSSTVSVLASKTNKRVTVGTYSDHVVIEPQASSTPTFPIVMRVEKEKGGAPERFCIEAGGKESRCAAISGSEHLVAVQAIAAKFVAPGKYGPHATATPDRELLADYLTTLGTKEAERSALLAEAAATADDERVARRVEKVSQTSAGTNQAQAYLDAFGDAPCAEAKPADLKRAQAQARSWIAAHDAKAKGTRKLDRVEVSTVCAKGTTSYVIATWMYLAADKEATSRAGLFSFGGKGGTLLADASGDGSFDCDGGACSGPPPVDFPAEAYTRGASVIALVIGAPNATDQQRAVTVFVDGVPTKGPDQGKELSVVGENIVADTATPPKLWHWDGAAWKAVEKPAAIVAQDARTDAYLTLDNFDLAKWSAGAAYKKTIEDALAILETPAH